MFCQPRMPQVILSLDAVGNDLDKGGEGTEEGGSGLMGMLKWGKQSKHLYMFEEIEEDALM